MAPSPTIRRLLKETSELSAASKNPNPAFHAAPVSDNDLHEWHFTLLGPPAPSPYAGGLYHGRISLPPSYPLKPPNFRFLTPSGRFEVNREICLSISGFHEETWMPAWGVRTALTALRSFMAESGTAGQVGGLESPKEVRERLAKESRGWKCPQCGSRTNEEIMKEWWESCVEKGVKVGEDVGLEVLPEGLSLEAKIPRGSDEKGKAREEVAQEKALDDASQTIPNQSYNEASHQKQSSISRENGSATTHQAITLPPQSPTRGTVSTSPIQNLAQDSLLTPTSPDPDLRPSPPSPSIPQHQRHNQNNHSISSLISQASTQPLQINGQPMSTADPRRPIRPQDEEDYKSLIIDRAIYAVVVALFIMAMKKIFYPANRGSDWEDFSLVKER